MANPRQPMAEKRGRPSLSLAGGVVDGVLCGPATGMRRSGAILAGDCGGPGVAVCTGVGVARAGRPGEAGLAAGGAVSRPPGRRLGGSVLRSARTVGGRGAEGGGGRAATGGHSGVGDDGHSPPFAARGRRCRGKANLA